jgi:hypothetical protein
MLMLTGLCTTALWRVPPVRMDVRNAVGMEGLTGVVTPVAAMGAIVGCEGGTTDAATLLQRYIQLRSVLPSAETLSDDVVEGLVRRVEAEHPVVAFDDDKIQGEWQLVYQKNAKQATHSQKALTGLPAYANFMLANDGKTKIFRNLVTVSRRITVVADVAYTQPAAKNGPPCRLGSTIDGGVLEVSIGRRFGWKPLRIPLPLKGVGWLDVTYLSDSMRVTRGNRGGVFVHLRPELLTRETAGASRLIDCQLDCCLFP